MVGGGVAALDRSGGANVAAVILVDGVKVDVCVNAVEKLKLVEGVKVEV